MPVERALDAFGRPGRNRAPRPGVTAARDLVTGVAPRSSPSWTVAAVGLGSFAVYAVAVFFLQLDSTLLLAGTVWVGMCLAIVSWDSLVGMTLAAGFLAGVFRYGYGTWSAYAIPEALVALLLVRWATGLLEPQSAPLSGTATGRAYILLAVYCVLQLLNPEAPLLRSLFGLRAWLMYTALLFVGYSSFRSVQQLESLCRTLILLAAATAAYGVWQWPQGPEALAGVGGWYGSRAATMLWISADKGGVFRAPSTFVTSTTFAQNMAMVLVLALGSAISARSSTTWRVLCVASMALMAAGIAVSGSRAGPAYLFVALLVMLTLIPRLRTVIAITLMVGLSLWLIDQITQGVVIERFATLLTPDIFFWKWAAPLVTGVLDGIHYPLGRGLGFVIGLPQLVVGQKFEGLATGAIIDSGWGMVAAELGLPGLALFLWFATATGLGAIRAWRGLPDDGTRELFLGPTIWAAAFPLLSPLIGPHASAPISIFQWLLVGMLLRAGTVHAGNGRPQSMSMPAKLRRRVFPRTNPRRPPPSSAN